MWLAPVISVLRYFMHIGEIQLEFPQITNLNMWITYKNISFFYLLMGIIIQWFAGYNLKNFLVPNSVDFIKKFLLIYPGFGLLIDLLLLPNIFAVNPAALIISYYTGPLIWYFYFKKLVRVKNTYFTIEKEDENVSLNLPTKTNINFEDDYWKEKQVLDKNSIQLEKYIEARFEKIKNSILQRKSLNLIYEETLNDSERIMISFEDFKNMEWELYWIEIHINLMFLSNCL